jgi:hypothetical protein
MDLSCGSRSGKESYFGVSSTDATCKITQSIDSIYVCARDEHVASYNDLIISQLAGRSSLRVNQCVIGATL